MIANRRLVRLLAAGFGALCLSLSGGAGGALASVGPTAATGPDFCTTETGVTVVVDLTEFGAGVVVRCVEGPLPSSYDGWDALTDAGFSPQAPSRTPGFVCRLAGEPSQSRTFDIPEDSEYHEQCVNTPPTSAYWGYWYAKNGGSWTYSSSGAASHRVIEGGFEGWAFALNSGGHPPKPGVPPQHPVESPDTPTTHQGGGGAPSGGGASGGPSTHHGGGTPTSGTPSSPSQSPSSPSDTKSGDKPRHRKHRGEQTQAGPTSAGPTSSAPTTDDVLVTSDLPSDADSSDSGGGSAAPTLIGVGVVALLGIGAGLTAWKRRSG